MAKKYLVTLIVEGMCLGSGGSKAARDSILFALGRFYGSKAMEKIKVLAHFEVKPKRWWQFWKRRCF